VRRDGAICYGDIASAADLPAGWTDEQDAGTYRLRRRDDDALFGLQRRPAIGEEVPVPAVGPAAAART